MNMRDIMNRAAHPCQTPGAQFHITVADDRLGAVVDLPEPVRLDLDQDDAETIEDMLHNALEAVVKEIVAQFDDGAEDDWAQASRDDQ